MTTHSFHTCATNVKDEQPLILWIIFTTILVTIVKVDAHGNSGVMYVKKGEFYKLTLFYI